MPRRRKRGSGLIGKDERYRGRRSRDRERYEEEVWRNLLRNRQARDSIRHDIEHRLRDIKTRDMIHYRTLYNVYRERIAENIRTWLERHGIRYYGKPDKVNKHRWWRWLKRLILTDYEELFDWLGDYIMIYRPSLFSRTKVRLRGDIKRFKRLREEFYHGTAVPLMITMYHNNTLDIYFTRYIDELLGKPEFLPKVFEALNHIFNQVLATNYRVTMSPEDIERLKDILMLLYRYYVSYTREKKQCMRSQFLIKLTPITLRYARGYAVRIYVLRWTRVDNIRSGVLRVTDPVDLYWSFLMDKKYRDEYVSSLQAIGETGYLTGEEAVGLWRDYTGQIRDMIKLYQLIYRSSEVLKGYRRATGRRENMFENDHCSVYIGFTRSNKSFRYWWYNRERLICKKYHVC